MKKILALIFTYLFIFVQISHAGWWLVSGQRTVVAGGAVELITNGDFGTGDITGWDKNNSVTSVTSTICRVEQDTAWDIFGQYISIVNGVTYNYSFDVTAISLTGGNIIFTDDTTTMEAFTITGSYSGSFTAGANAFVQFQFINTTIGDNFSIDNVSVSAQ